MSASPPVPPNWAAFLNAAQQSVTAFYKMQVQPSTYEFQVISDMVDFPIIKLERVINTSIWKKFVNERKELLARKSSDLELLSALGLTEQELLHRAHINANFTPDPSVSAINYTDNIALLFHGSKSKLDTVLTQGLDDRLGFGGIHGNGIYFTDSATTALGFDTNGALLIVAVFLGDCYSVDKLGSHTFLREPMKKDGQKRNHEDLFFDSIVARRGEHSYRPCNEFVIFNRNQCCPLYVLTHRAGMANFSNTFAPPPPTIPASISPNTMLNFSTNGLLGSNPPPALQLPPPWPPVSVPQPGTSRGLVSGKGPGARSATRRTYKNHLAATSAAAAASAYFIPALSFGAAPSQNSTAILPAHLTEFTEAQKLLPPFVWTQRHGGGRLLSTYNQWPFFARTMFDLMKNDEVELTAAGPSASPPAGGSLSQPTDDGERALKISKLVDLGFVDASNNARVLDMLGCDLEAAIDHILTNQPEPGPAVTKKEEWEDPSRIAQVPPTFTLADFVADEVFDADMFSKIGVPALPVAASGSELTVQTPTEAVPTTSISVGQGDQDQVPVTDNQPGSSAQVAQGSTTAVILNEDCQVCYMAYPSDSSQWRSLACGHKLCITCYSRLEKKRTTMSGQSHVFMKCPFCKACTGQQIGNCPTGTMNVTQVSSTLPGYEQYGTQVVTYEVRSPLHYLNRTAYLPSSPEGLRLAELLRTAWDRRLIFCIGTSLTTGEDNTLVWNIHHKTASYGGVQLHGYPDPTYLERLRDELKLYGIE